MEGNYDNIELLAHSPPKDSLVGDPYARHVNAVRDGAKKRAEEMFRYTSKLFPGLLNSIVNAATFHDLGKLDPEIQSVFRNGKGKLYWDHIDAGVAHLSNEQNWMAAWLVRAHHAPGFPQKSEHFTEQTDRHLRGRRRDDNLKERHEEQIIHTNSMIKYYLSDHKSVVGHINVDRKRPVHGLPMRLALSCLVDADHTDTMFADTGYQLTEPPEPRWKERLENLCEYVKNLPAGESEDERLRNTQRKEFFDACLNSQITERLVACEGSVGIGKTTAVTAYLIRRALEEGLRRIIIIAPYTNILTQTAKRLRKALVLSGEKAEQVIVEHHHRADFSHREDRELAVLWSAPIVLTTAVSFFETLAACSPSALRKLHSVPGSAIFLDEAHAALPSKLWPQNWEWVHELALDWGCIFVFASGSLSRFWENPRIIAQSTKLPELLPKQQHSKIMQTEQVRVKYVKAGNGQVLNIKKLIHLIKRQTGPRLIILNTVQNAAVVADYMAKESDLEIFHISTALTPNDRKKVLKKVEEKIKHKDSMEWALVATSCVEAGVDLSFRCAFRERFGTASIIQVGGRVNRNGEYNIYGGGKVFDFVFADDLITQHPAANVSSEVLRLLMEKDKLNHANPAQIVTEAMELELKNLGGLPSEAELLVKAEKERNYPQVQELGRVINTDTRFVVIDTRLKELITMGVPVSFRTLLQGSVQIWAKKIEKLCLQPIISRTRSHYEIYEWQYDYDPDFLGYMEGVLKLEKFISAGGMVI